jgi:hypothetical protein
MRIILEYIDRKTDEYRKLPLFHFMRDDSFGLRQRLAFVPDLAHFVMSFADMYAHVLRNEPATDQFQELVNAHTYEDGGHWKWFLADLATLNEDSPQRVSETLRELWGPGTLKTRMLTYRICRLGLGASSIEKLVLVQCIEAVGKVSLEHAAPLGRELAKQLPKPLVYFGSHHLDTESGHTLEEEEVRGRLEQVALDLAQRDSLRSLVDQTFEAFREFSDDLHKVALARAGRDSSPAA